MNDIWMSFVGLLTLVFTWLVQLFGGSVGLAIITISSSVRIALLPFSIRMAIRARKQQEILQKLQPELEQLKKRYQSNPRRLTEETLKLYRRYGYSPFNVRTLGGIFIQLPIFAGLYSVIRNGITLGNRFLWIADLAKPDFILTVIIGALTLVSAFAAPGLSHQSRNMMLIVPTIITLIFVCQISSGLGLYWAASSVIGIAQNIVLRKKN